MNHVPWGFVFSYGIVRFLGIQFSDSTRTSLNLWGGQAESCIWQQPERWIAVFLALIIRYSTIFVAGNLWYSILSGIHSAELCRNHICWFSIDWFKGKVTEPPHGSCENPWFPVKIFPTNPIPCWLSRLIFFFTVMETSPGCSWIISVVADLRPMAVEAGSEIHSTVCLEIGCPWIYLKTRDDDIWSYMMYDVWWMMMVVVMVTTSHRSWLLARRGFGSYWVYS